MHTKQLKETILSLDNLRRNMLFIDRGHEDIVSLTSLITEIEHLHTVSQATNNRFKSYLVAAISCMPPLFENVADNTRIPFVRLGNYVRQMITLVRQSRELDIDYSTVLAVAIQIDITSYFTDSSKEDLPNAYFYQQIKSLINATT